MQLANRCLTRRLAENYRTNSLIFYFPFIDLCRFRANRIQCVHPMSKLIFVCPNTATTVTKLASSDVLRPLYENLWLVSRQSYERCEVNKTTDSELILCDSPFDLKYYMVIFKKYSASLDPIFEPGKDYYFIGKKNQLINPIFNILY